MVTNRGKGWRVEQKWKAGMMSLPHLLHGFNVHPEEEESRSTTKSLNRFAPPFRLRCDCIPTAENPPFPPGGSPEKNHTAQKLAAQNSTHHHSTLVSRGVCVGLSVIISDKKFQFLFIGKLLITDFMIENSMIRAMIIGCTLWRVI